AVRGSLGLRGCEVARVGVAGLRGYEVARLRGCEVTGLRGYWVARLRGCWVARSGVAVARCGIARLLGRPSVIPSVCEGPGRVGMRSVWPLVPVPSSAAPSVH